MDATRLNVKTVLVFLPLLWCFAFDFNDGLLMASLAGFLWAMKGSKYSLANSAILTLLLIRMYLPVFEYVDPSPRVVFLVGAGLLLVSIGSFFVWRENQANIQSVIPIFATLAVPLLLGATITIALARSEVSIPEALIPSEGLAIGSGILFFWAGALHLVLLGVYVDRTPVRPIATSLAVGAILLTLMVRFVGIEWRMRNLISASVADSGEWSRLLSRSEAFGSGWLERRVRRAALSSEPGREDMMRWVSWSKAFDGGTPIDFTGIQPFYRILARGGNAFEKEQMDGDEAVALDLDTDENRFWVLTRNGKLARIGEEATVRTASAEVGPFVHMNLDREGFPLLLEAGGRLQRFQDNDFEILSTTLYGSSAAHFRRLTVGPTSGEIWAMDLFGVLYFLDLGVGWIRDDRFQKATPFPHERFEVDIARDLTLSRTDTLALLTCHGEIWASSRDSEVIRGPFRGAHFWPDEPIGQSIGANKWGYDLADRFGGFHYSPYPADSERLAHRKSYLFPRSLPRRKDDVVDHVFLQDNRWIYMLTRSGSILTNSRWSGIWVD